MNERGKSFVKVCGDEDLETDTGARQELVELGCFSEARNTEPKTEGLITPISQWSSRRQGKSPEAPMTEPSLVGAEKSLTRKPVTKPTIIYDDESTESEAEIEASATKTSANLGRHEDLDSGEEVEVNNRKQFCVSTSNPNSCEIPGRSTRNKHKPINTPTRFPDHDVPHEQSIGVGAAALSPPSSTANALTPALSSTSASESNTAVSIVTSLMCPICSLENDTEALRCAVCCHVLAPSSLPGCWACKSESCRALAYLNVGDNGICGLCGTPKA